MRIIPLRLLLLIGLSACQTHRPPNANYETVEAPPNRRPNEAKRLHQQAVQLIHDDRVTEAEQKLKQALKADVMHGPAHNNLGKLYDGQGKYYLAAWEFQYAIKLLPGRPEPRNNLGLVFEAVRKLDQAIEHYAQAHGMAPDNVDVLCNLARARLRRGDTGPEVTSLLENVVLKDARATWREWARLRLALLGAKP